MKKKTYNIFWSSIIAVVLCACGNSNANNSKTDVSTNQEINDNVESQEIDENSVVKLYCESSSLLKVVIQDEHVQEFYSNMQNGTSSDEQFYIEFFTIQGDIRNVYAKMQIFPDYASFTSEEKINEKYDDAGELMSADSLWGYYIMDAQALQNNALVNGNEIAIKFEGLEINEKLNVEGLYYELGYMSNSFVTIADGAVAQILAVDNDALSVNNNPTNLFHINNNYVYDESVELIIFNQEFTDYVTAGNDGAYIRFYKSKEDYENDKSDLYVSVGSYDYDIFFEPYKAVVLQKEGTDERFYKDENTENPVYIEDNAFGIKLRDSDLKSEFANYGYYKIVIDYENVILSGTIDEACVGDYSMAYGDIPEVPVEYTDPSDEDFFKPISRFYRVYSKAYPLIPINNYRWNMITDDSHRKPVNAYGPDEFYESSCVVTYLEAVDPYGDMVQSIAKNSFEGENDLLFAYCSKYYFPIDETGRDEATFDGFPDTFFHDGMVSMLDVDEISECLIGYDENVIYMDFTEKYKLENELYDERYGANDYWEGRYELVPVRTKYILLILDEGFDDKDIKKLDQSGTIMGTFTYQFNVENPWTGNSNYFTKELSGNYSGYSTIGQLMK